VAGTTPPARSVSESAVWLFDLFWALAVFFGLRALAARLLAVRIGPVASFRIRPFADQRDRNLIAALANRFILAFFSASVGVVSVLLLSLRGGPLVFQTRLDVLAGYIGLAAATVLGLRVVVAVTRDRE
jgi:hypothetical protein